MKFNYLYDSRIKVDCLVGAVSEGGYLTPTISLDDVIWDGTTNYINFVVTGDTQTCDLGWCEYAISKDCEAEDMPDVRDVVQNWGALDYGDSDWCSDEESSSFEIVSSQPVVPGYDCSYSLDLICTDGSGTVVIQENYDLGAPAIAQNQPVPTICEGNIVEQVMCKLQLLAEDLFIPKGRGIQDWSSLRSMLLSKEPFYYFSNANLDYGSYSGTADSSFGLIDLSAGGEDWQLDLDFDIVDDIRDYVRPYEIAVVYLAFGWYVLHFTKNKQW